MKERSRIVEPINILQELVSIPSYVDKANGIDERKIAQYITNFLKTNTDMVVETQEVIDGRYNVIARGKGPTRLLMIGHTDTVEPRAGYKHGPFGATIEDGKLYGLGACDMKSGLACILSAASQAESTDGLMLLFYIDEEYDFAGMKAFVENLPENLQPELVVSADGEEMKLSFGCRGLIEISGYIRGKTGHASRPETGKNAIYQTVDIARHLKAHLGSEYKSELGSTSLNLARLNGGLIQEQRNQETDTFSNEGNNIPDLAKFIIDIRPAITTLTAQKVIDMINEKCKEDGYTIENSKIRHDLGAWLCAKTDVAKAISIIKSVLGTEVQFTDPSNYGYVDIAMLWQKIQRPSFIIGPGPKHVAHTSDEFVEITNVEKLTEIFGNLIKAYTHPQSR